MEATLYPAFGPVWYPRRRYVVIAETLPSGAKIEKLQEVTDPHADYDYSEDEAQAGNHEESSSSSSDSESSEMDDRASFQRKSESSFEKQAAAAAALPVAPAAAPVMMSSAAAVEHQRLKALHAEVRADPRSALSIIQPEKIACDTCDDGTGEAGGGGGGEGEESDSDSSSSSSSSEEEEAAGCNMCDRCKKKKKKTCKHVCQKPKPCVNVCCKPKPCNKTVNTKPIVKGECAKEKCDKHDIEVTETYQAWVASMSPFAPIKAQTLLPSAADVCVKKLSPEKAINATIENANALIQDFVAKGGLKIDSNKEVKTLNSLTQAIGRRVAFEGTFDHAYVCSPVGVASVGAVIPDKHVQTLTIGVSGEPRTSKKGENVYYLSLAVKPGTAARGTEAKAGDVFRIRVENNKMVTEVIQGGMEQLQKSISIMPTREAITKIGSLLARVS